jgi:hypothetical protein
MELCSSNERHQCCEFNERLASVWIVVEHAFGQLKGQFPALKLLSGWGMEHIYFGVEALMILHNIFIIFADHPKDISGYDLTDPTPALENELHFPFVGGVLMDNVVQDRRAAHHEDMWFETRSSLKVDGE